MKEVFVEILGNLVWILIGLSASYLYKLLFRILPTKRLWNLSNPKDLIICVSTASKMGASEFYTPTTGIGEIRALGLIVTSLNRAYKNIKISNVFLSKDEVHTKIENDIILLGGPKYNRVTKKFLDKLSDLSIVDEIENEMVWKVHSDEGKFSTDVKEGIISKDYGLIIRMNNPFSTSKSTLTIFAGAHTYGTIAAARYFTENMYKEIIQGGKISQNIAAIVSCNVSDGWPVSLCLVKKYVF